MTITIKYYKEVLITLKSFYLLDDHARSNVKI